VVSDETLPVDAFGAPIAVGLAPPAVTFNPAGTRAYVTNQDGQTLHVIDVASATVIDTIVLGNAGFSVITSRDGTEVFASVATGQVYVISGSTNAIVDSIVLPWGVHAFARHPTDDRIYMSTRLAVFEINARTHQVLRSFRTGDLSQRLAVSPDGRELLVANEVLGLDIWRIWDAARDTTIQLEAFGLGLSPDGEKIYLVGSLSREITIVDRRTRLVDTVLTVGGKPRNVAFSQDGRVAVITNEADFVTVVE
jgi:YVTN family beta-propeller protein